MVNSDSLPPRLLGTAPAAGVAAGTPGKFAPWNARRPADLAGLQAAGALGQVAAWAPGQYVELRNATRAHWDGDSWAAGPAPAGVGAERPVGTVPSGTVQETSPQVSTLTSPEASTSTVPDGTVEVPGTVEQLSDEAAAALIAAGPLPDLLSVTAGTPGTYDPAQTAAQRPRNVTEMRKRATPAAAEPWAAGQYVLVGENGKRAHWDGETWQRGEAPA